jgi:hypothetical protein
MQGKWRPLNVRPNSCNAPKDRSLPNILARCPGCLEVVINIKFFYLSYDGILLTDDAISILESYGRFERLLPYFSTADFIIPLI